MQHRVLVIAILLAFNVLRVVYAMPAPLSARDAYQQVSLLRDRHADVIWNGAAATPEDLQKVLADLDQGLAALKLPIYRDLGDGDFYLKMRTYNFLVDRVIVQTMLGQTSDAIQSFDEMTTLAWLPPPDRPEFQLLLSDPRASAIKARIDVGARWRNGSMASPYRPELSVEERVAGLSAIWSLAREHFVWFDHVPTLDWDRVYQETILKVINARSTYDYYRELMRFTALLRDGHSNTYPPEELAEKFYSKPGLATALTEGSVIITQISDPSLAASGLRVGDEILRLDGLEVHEYADSRVAPFQSSSSPQDLAVRTYEYALLGGAATDSIQLDVRHANGARSSVLARRSGYPRTSTDPSEAFTLRQDGIAVLKARQFEDDAADRLLELNVSQLAKAKALIIDIRGNGGGSSRYGLDLLTRLTPDPVPISRQSVRADPDLLKGKVIAWRTLQGEPYRRSRAQVFGGPVALLIDARTFSAAEDTAVSFRSMRRGILVGSPSAGSTGQPFMIELPGGGHARICVKRDSYPDGAEFVGRGVQPDINVPVTIREARNATDPVMERASIELKRMMINKR